MIVSNVASSDIQLLVFSIPVEKDVIEMAHEVERLYQDRCMDRTFESCYKSNYDACISTFPSPMCLPGEQLSDATCGDGSLCSRLWDHSCSAVL